MKICLLPLCALLLTSSIFYAADAPPNTLNDLEKREGWTLLFDGKTFAGWHGYGLPGFPDHGWSVADGCIHNTKTNGRPGGGGGDIITTELFSDFEFRF